MKLYIFLARLALLWMISFTVQLKANPADSWSPDFLIIGAQKSGTTALKKCIKQHPLILLPRKEVHFFDVKFHKGENWYREKFPERPSLDYVIGEKSPYYLFHPLAAKRAHSLYPNAKIIVVLRNPVDRAYSQYWFNVHRNMERLSFEEAIKAEPLRLAGETEKIALDPSYVSKKHRIFSYLSRSLYVNQMKQWLSYYPREQMLILSASDLRKNPDAVMQTVFSFLGVPHFHEIEYDSYRSSYEPMDINLRKQLCEHFRPYNKQLEELLDIQFDWD